MFPVNFRKPLMRPVIAAAFASAGLLIVGCADEPPARASMSNGPVEVQAADTNRATPPTDTTVSMAYPTGDRATSDLLLEETAPREARVGQPVNYQIRVTNLRNIAMNGIVLEQKVPANLKLTSNPTTQPAVDANSNETDHRAQIEVGDLGPKQSRTVQMSGTAGQQGTIDTCLTARYNPPTLCSVVTVVSPALSLVAEGPSQADICADLTYSYKVTNTGTGTAHNVVIEETLPDGLQTVSGQRSVASNVGNLDAGQSRSIAVHLKAAQAGKYTSNATARSEDAGRAQAEQIATAVLAPRLSVTVAGPKEEYLGTPIAYQVTVKNEGDAPAAGGKVRLGATPGSVAFAGAQNADGSKISEQQPGTGQDLGTLAPGESRTATINFNPQRGGDLTLNATAEARCAVPVTTPVMTRILTITASALIVTHDPDPVRVGTNVKYHIVVQNKGTGADHNVVVTATLPASEQYVNGTGASSGNVDGQKVTFGAIPELGPKQTIAWDVEARAIKAEDTELHVSMTSESTKNPAIKVEPTKIYGAVIENQQRTNIAPAPTSQPASVAPVGTDFSK